MTFPPPTERQARIIWLALTGLAVAALAGLAGGLIWGLKLVVQLLGPVLWPLAVAGVIAYLLDPVVDWLERRKVRRPRAILCVFAVAVVMVATLFSSVVPQLVSETRQLAARVPDYAASVQTRVIKWMNKPSLRRIFEKQVASLGGEETMSASKESGSILSTNSSPLPAGNTPVTPRPLDQQTLQAAATKVAEVLPKIGSWLFGQVGRVASWFGVLVGLALIPVYTFYLLLEKHSISSRWTQYLPLADSGFKNELVFVLNSINNYLIAFFRGQLLVALCDGILYGLGFLLVGLPYAVLIGAMAVGLTMIPFLGAIVTCSTALIIAVLVFGDWSHPLLVLAVFGCVQGLEGLVISPRIMGGRVGLHPMTIIIAVMVGTTLLGGLLGGILAIPLTAALRVVMSRYVWNRNAATTTGASGQ
jgi:predicted PurR-regulated permease PerM